MCCMSGSIPKAAHPHVVSVFIQAPVVQHDVATEVEEDLLLFTQTPRRQTRSRSASTVPPVAKKPKIH